MERKQEIEQRIAELKEELDNVEGSPTEIYTRIVGYYRSLKNWNRGKREEYNHRVTFGSGSPSQDTKPIAEIFAVAALEAASANPDELETEPPHAAPTTGAATASSGRPDSAEGVIRSYQYFFRESCPNCPPVKQYVEKLKLDGQMVNVDTGEGMEAAIQHQILSTPTVLLKDRNGETVAQAGSVDQLRTILESAS